MKYASLKGDDDVLTIGLNRAVTLMAEAKTRSSGRELGDHGGNPVTVRKGRFGAYVKCGKINATLPPNMEMDAITLAEAIVLIDARAAKGPAKRKAKAPAKKKTTKAKKKTVAKKKTGAKKKPAKKTPAKKSTPETTAE